MQGQLALITPLSMSGERPDNSLPGSPAYPSHPIELPPLPPGIHPSHPIVLPPSGAAPSHPIFVPIEPTHPIDPGGEPPAPDQGLPGSPAAPDQGLPGSGGGGTPSHPIALPPGTIWPPLNPGDGVYGKGLLLIIVVGADGVRKFKWVVVDGPEVWPKPPAAQPK